MKKQKDIVFLIILLSLLSASIGILHGRKKSVDPSVVADDVRFILARQDAVDYLQPLLISGNIDLVATTLDQYAGSLLITTLDTILQDQTIVLSDEQKIQLLAAVLLESRDSQKQKIIIDRMMRYFSAYPLFTPMVPQYASAISLLISRVGKEAKEQLASWIDRSFDRAIEMNDVELLAGLYAAGVHINPERASSLLYRVVRENKKPAFVPFLIHQLKANIHYSPDGSRTPLIAAVQENNGEMVKVLMQEGANPTQVLDAAVGSAQQIAFEREYIPIELILKKYK